MERVQEENHAAVVNGNDDNHREQIAVSDAGTLAWCGYLLVAAPVLTSWAGHAVGAGTVLSAYALLLLGVAFITLAMLAPAKPKTI